MKKKGTMQELFYGTATAVLLFFAALAIAEVKAFERHADSKNAADERVATATERLANAAEALCEIKTRTR